MLTSRFIRFFEYLNFKTLRQVIRETNEHRLTGLASEIAYNNLLALFPTIIAVLAAIGMLEIPQNAVDYLGRQILSFAPEQALILIRDFIEDVKLPEGEAVVFVSILIALWIASGAIGSVMNAMEQIHKIPPRQRRPFWKMRLISLLLAVGSIVLVLAASFLIFISDWVVEFALNFVATSKTGLLAIWNLLRWIAALAILASAFSLIYRYGPSRWKAGTPLIPGAIIAALLWAALSRLFRMYVASFANYSITYGTLSAGIVLLLWLNLSALAMLIGAQLNVVVGKAMQEKQKQPPRKRAL